MSPVDGGAGVLQLREVEDDFIEADALNFRHRGLSGKHRVVMTESHVYLQTAPGATLPMLPYLPKVRAGPGSINASKARTTWGSCWTNGFRPAPEWRTRSTGRGSW